MNQTKDNQQCQTDRLTSKSSLNKSRASENSKPIRLSDYHGERSKSKTKEFVSNIMRSDSKINKSSYYIRDMRRTIQKAIDDCIKKLELKKKQLLDSWCETELLEAETLIKCCIDILSKQSFPPSPLSCISDFKQDQNSHQSLPSPNPQTRCRGITLPQMFNRIKGFQLQSLTPKTQIPVNHNFNKNETSLTSKQICMSKPMFQSKVQKAMQAIVSSQKRVPLVKLQRPNENSNRPFNYTVLETRTPK